MRGFQVLSTRPGDTYYQRSGGSNFALKDFELLTAVLSALEWRRHNGTIKLYADAPGAEYFANLGLSAIWDEGIDTETLERSDLDTSFNVFWAYARTVALAAEQAPCVLMDMDLIVWRNLDSLIRSPFMAIHAEGLDFDVYVPKEQLNIAPGYTWGEWDWTVSPVNAAVLYFGRDDVMELCRQEGLKFMDGNYRPQEFSWPAHAVFVEQRLYPMCAASLEVQAEYFLEDYHGERLADGSANDAFTHLWLYKRKLMRDEEARRDICERLAARLLRDFPEWCHVLANIHSIAPYLKYA